MALNRTAAAYLAYFAYIDQALDTPNPSDFAQLLAQVPQGAANGPWTLAWGPALNDGTLCYVAQGADGTYAVAFRGTNTDDEVTGWFQNIVEDGSASLVPWMYPSAGGTLMITTGTNIALALAIAATDPVTDMSLLDYLRGLTAAGPLELMVAGHSLGGAIAVAATGWLQDQLGKVAQATFTLWPHTFAAPTTWNKAFATWFATTFTYYAAVNGNDIVPMAWANLSTVANTYPSPYPSLYTQEYLLWLVIEAASAFDSDYAQIAANNPDPFLGTLSGGQTTWFEEAGLMHSMALQYFPHATNNTTAPPLPHTTATSAPKPRVARRKRRVRLGSRA
ncbi:MAG TPA: hypothetical protein VND19_20530 [Acetobacteraceae bacterium]|nr:hypothetical protein [Acetobacteraceae bacterium]